MKILLTSDWHLDAVTAGIPRLGEFKGYLNSLLVAVHREEVDAVFFLGDAFDPGRMLGPRYTTTLINAAVRLDAEAPMGSVWISGNHDVVETSEITTTLSPLAEAAREHPKMWVCEVPLVFRVGPIAVLALPYMAAAADTYPTRWATAFEAAANVSVPLVVIGHLTVPGALLGSESAEFARGRDVDIPMSQLAKLNPVLIANGHYHRAQHVGDCNVVIPGSPHRFTFGERHDVDKGYVIVEIPDA